MHTCPRRGCSIQVRDVLFACRTDWFLLSPATRAAIYATNGRRLGDRERMDAIRAALEDWQVLDNAKEKTE